ncbi:hypothetical protein FKW77_001021 [Venturia effusa]|uniref:Choline-sulfatase n=1 Tax=Venturia effusa TaxID=50376 RepID=A0A517L2P2_9PEZI|nr:hypothetical protein FKW77_001021 [Venturia effusa]
MAPHAESPTHDMSDFLSANGIHMDGFNSHINGNGAQDASKPNVLFIMADQLTANLLKMHDPKSVIKTPNLDKLAETGVVFDSAYCNSPLCAPSRFCLVSGKLPSEVGAFDNASHLNADVPTYAHYLRREGYETTLAGKMHFIGPDQLHGFENRLTPDIYPGDFGWAVNWDEPERRLEWYHNMSSVLQAGPCVRSNQLDYDEEVMYKSTQYLYSYVRKEEQRPFCLTVSLTHPHDPYAISQSLWDQYEDVKIPMPEVTIPQDQQDPHSKRLLKCIDSWDNPIPDKYILRARRAYYAACTYVDNQIGKLLTVLKECQLDKNTIIIFSGDHGDMLGERSLWYKMSWFENSARVPLVVNYPPRFAPHRVKESVSTMDLLPTLVDLVGGDSSKLLPMDGRSLYPSLLGLPAHDHVFGEYMGEGTNSPLVMIRRGRYKYITSLYDPPQLYDLKADPKELHNLNNINTELADSFKQEAAAKWDLKALYEKVLTSQRQRRLCWEALNKGDSFVSWDYSPPDDGRTKYIRSQRPLDDLEREARFPPVDAFGNVVMTRRPHGVAGAKGE